MSEQAAVSDRRGEPRSEASTSSAWLLFHVELGRLWAPQYRRQAFLALGIVLLVQLVFTAALRQFGFPGRPGRFDWFFTLTQFTGLGSLLGPVPLFLPRQVWVNAPVAVWIGVLLACANTALVFLGPALAARSVAPDREGGRLRELVLTGLSPWQILMAKGLAAMLPLLAVMCLAAALLLGMLAGIGLTGKEHLLGTMPPPLPGMPEPTRLAPSMQRTIQLGITVLGWLATGGLLCAVGAASRSSRAALFWCYAVPFLLVPLLNHGVARVIAPPAFTQSMTHTLLDAGAMLLIQAAAAMLLYRRAARDLQQPDENEPWIQVRRPAMWDVPLNESPVDNE